MVGVSQNTVSGNTDLRVYLQDVLFKQFSENRKKIIEGTWNDARNAFRKLFKYEWKGKNEGEGWRSKTYVGIVRQKVISLVALIADQYFRTGRFPYGLKADAETELAMQGMDAVDREQIEGDIENFQRYMDEQLKDGKAIPEYTKLFFDLGIYGFGVQKRIRMDKVNPQFRNVSPEPDAPEVWERVLDNVVIPARERVSPWEMFWDLENGMRTGQCDIQRRLVSPYTLSQFKDKKFYLNDVLDAVVKEAQSDYLSKSAVSASVKDANQMAPALRDITHRVNNIELLECWGRAPKLPVLNFEKSLRDTGVPVLDIYGDPVAEDDAEGSATSEWVEVTATIARDKIIRYARSYQEERPFFPIVPQEIPDELAPDSVAITTMPAEGLINGSLRGMEDNGRLSGNVIVGTKDEYIENRDELEAGLEPGSTIRITADCDDVRKAFQAVEIPNVMSSYTPLIELGFRIADEDSLIPKLSQGIEVAEKKTAYEVSTVIERAAKFIGVMIRALDPFAEQHVSEIYQYDMEDPDFPIKRGNYKIDIQGFTMYQDEVVRGERLKQFLSLLLSDPSGTLVKHYKTDELVEAIARSMGINVTDFHKSAQQIMEEGQAEAEQMAMQEQAQAAGAAPTEPESASKAELESAQAEKNRAEAKKALVDANARQREVQVKEALAMHKVSEVRKPVKTTESIKDIEEGTKPPEQIIADELGKGAPVQ